LRLFGHRGASAHLPENTVEAFGRALEDGANGLELDVHLSRDGHVVVAHDPDGQRMAGRDQRIRDCTLETLTGWNVAARFDGAGGLAMKMPTLAEVLKEFSDVPMSVDLKPDDHRIAPAILEVVRSHDAEQHVTVGSFNGAIVRLLRRLGYRGPTSLTQSEVALCRLLPVPLLRRLVKGQAAMLPLRKGKIALDRPWFIHRCRSLGLRVDYWVINEVDEGKKLLATGATGLVTDDPRALVSALTSAR